MRTRVLLQVRKGKNMENKNFKGWGVLAAAFIMSFIPTGIMSNCFSLYMAPVCENLGFSTTSWSMVNLIASFASAIGAMIIAGMYQKKNMKITMVIVTAGTCICWFVATLCTAIWQFYLVFALSNIFMAGLTQLPISMLVTAWFEDKRATMMSIAYAGGGLGGAVWAPVISRFISASGTGWKTAMLFSAGVVAVVMILTALFLVKRSPAEYGTEPYRTGDSKEKEKEATQNSNAWIGVSKKTATKSGAWRCIIGVVMFTGILSAGVTTHVPNFVTSVAQDGGSLQGTILSVYSIVSIIGMVAGGALMDKIGIRKTVLGATVLVIIGLASLYAYSVTGTTAIAFGYSIFFAIAMFLPKVLPSVLMSKVFGTKEYGAIYAFANLFFLIGAAFGSVLTSIIQGIVGYGITWIVYMFVAIALFLCVSGAIKGGEKLQANYPQGDN